MEYCKHGCLTIYYYSTWMLLPLCTYCQSVDLVFCCESQLLGVIPEGALLPFADIAAQVLLSTLSHPSAFLLRLVYRLPAYLGIPSEARFARPSLALNSKMRRQKTFF